MPHQRRYLQTALEALAESKGANPVRRALWLDALDQRLRPVLPPGLAAHVQLANVDGNTLVYLVDAPAWHARLRMASTDLIDAARSIGLGVTHLTIKTRREPKPQLDNPTSPRTNNRISPTMQRAFDAARVTPSETGANPLSSTRRTR